jgi:hypothetical protein
MPLLSIPELRLKFPFVIHTDIEDEQLEMSLDSASIRLEKWVTSAVYADATLPETGSAPLTTDARRRRVLRNAEGHLAMHFAILGLNTNLRHFGLVANEEVEGNTVNTYFQPEKIEKFKQQYLDMARSIARPYIVDEEEAAGVFENPDV